MFQLSFLNTGLLIFAAATILPLIIWLLARKKPRRIIFSTIRFILKTEKEQKSRTQLKNILLLIIRMLIILLVVLAASRPSLHIPNLKPAKNHPPTAVAIMLDTSFSMDYTPNSKSTLEVAKNRIAEINNKLTPQDLAVLVTSDENWNRMNSQLQSGKLPENLISNIKSTWLPLSMDKMLEYATAKLKESQFSNREIYFISDGQAQVIPGKPEIPVLILPPLKPAVWENLSCSNAAPVMQLTSKQQTQLISFDITNHGSNVRRDVLVRVDFNGIKAAEKFVTLQPGQKLKENLPVQITSNGWQNGYVEVLDERLTADNRSWFTFHYDLNPNIGVITQRGSLPLILQTILSVFATPQGSVKLLSPANINFQQLKDYSALVVYDAGELTPRLREFLQTCSQSRKGVLYLAGPDMTALWKAWLGQNFGLQINQYNTSSVPVSYVNSYHSITSLIDGRQLAKTSVADFWTARNSGSANILLAAENSPLAVSGENNLLWLFDIGGTQSRFFLDASFPVFAFRSLQHLANSQFEAEQQPVGQLLSADEIIMPNGDKNELNGGSMKTYEPGIYTISWRGSNPQNLAISYDSAESDYKPLNFPKSSSYHLLGNRWQEQLFLSRLGHDIWKYLLLAALFLLILELAIVKSEEWKTGSIKT
jgi:hypothetical protein